MESLTPDGVADAHTITMQHIRDDGAAVADSKPFAEILGYTTGMSNPRSRVLVSDAKPWNVVGAVARFTWLIAGSDRLEDIAYYENRVRMYSDDQLIVPGSSYGRRVFAAAPGLNQIDGVVRGLTENPHSRRAAAVVWLPEDAVRKSKDIPCTFGLFFHIRDDALTMTTVMRSNNALTLLPYNFFEFSMLGEMVAAQVGVDFGRYVHWAASMHTFDADEQRIADTFSDTTRRSAEMPVMPRGTSLEQGRELARREAELRHADTESGVLDVLSKARETLDPYWLDLFHVLYAWGLAKRGMVDAAIAICATLPVYFRDSTRAQIDQLIRQVAAEDGALLGLSDIESDELRGRAAMVSESFNDGEGSILWVAKELDRLSSTEQPATTGELLKVMEELRNVGREDVALAARDSGLRVVTREDVRQAFNAVRGHS